MSEGRELIIDVPVSALCFSFYMTSTSFYSTCHHNISVVLFCYFLFVCLFVCLLVCLLELTFSLVLVFVQLVRSVSGAATNDVFIFCWTIFLRTWLE